VRTTSAALSERDRPARVGTQSTKALVDAESTAQEVVTDPAEEPIPASLAEETICAVESAKIVTASPAIYAVTTFPRTNLVVATACADDIPPAPASHEVVTGAGDNHITMVRTQNGCPVPRCRSSSRSGHDSVAPHSRKRS